MNNKKYFYLYDCKCTKEGAYTTMGGEIVRSSSDDGWVERKEVKVGDIISVIDISDSGEHYCYKLEIIGFNVGATEKSQVKTKVIVKANPNRKSCPVCGRL